MCVCGMVCRFAMLAFRRFKARIFVATSYGQVIYPTY